MAHTKGPWTFRELRGNDGLGYIESDGRDIIHAGVSDLSAAENRANAALIAAAPDLLALVVQYRDDLKRPPSGDSIYRRMEAIEAAIAKATQP
jgi:hypothetical protein